MKKLEYILIETKPGHKPHKQAEIIAGDGVLDEVHPDLIDQYHAYAHKMFGQFFMSNFNSDIIISLYFTDGTYYKGE